MENVIRFTLAERNKYYKFIQKNKEVRKIQYSLSDR